MIGNFEGVATSNTYSKCKLSSINCFSFNGNTNFVNLLSDASFDDLNVANNHFNDYGKIGQEETVAEIQNAGMRASGIKDEITYLTRNDIKIGIVGFSTYSWTTDMNKKENLQKLINMAKQNADIVIVVFHGGGEGIKYAHTPTEREWYLGEDRGDVRSFAHDAIDAGADIVLGSGPHVLRGIERYNDKIIAYSMGNFASANTLATSGALKTSAMLEAVFHKDGSLVSGTIFPFEIDKDGIPHPDLNNIAISTINELSKSDFDEQGVVLSSEGEIEIK
jgi:poly-gamma-glutamate capsule biosynthesis protein CapA/YwtB (metallophosphatase superfamily)